MPRPMPIANAAQCHARASSSACRSWSRSSTSGSRSWDWPTCSNTSARRSAPASAPGAGIHHLRRAASIACRRAERTHRRFSDELFETHPSAILRASTLTSSVSSRCSSTDRLAVRGLDNFDKIQGTVAEFVGQALIATLEAPGDSTTRRWRHSGIVTTTASSSGSQMIGNE